MKIYQCMQKSIDAATQVQLSKIKNLLRGDMNHMKLDFKLIRKEAHISHNLSDLQRNLKILGTTKQI